MDCVRSPRTLLGNPHISFEDLPSERAMIPANMRVARTLGHTYSWRKGGVQERVTRILRNGLYAA